MPRHERRLPIEHGEPRRLRPPARRSAAAVDLSGQAEVTVVVRSQGSEAEWQQLVAELTSGLPGRRRYLSRAALARKWGASAEDIEAVRKFAAGQRLKIVSADAVRRCVVISGSLKELARAFDVDFFAVDHPLGTFRSHRRAPRVPASIHAKIECILGLDNLPTATPHAAAARKVHSLDRRALLHAYAIPPDLTGKGQCVAIIELGGGFHKRDLVEYFGQFRLKPPRLRIRSIGGAKNSPAPPKMIRDFFETLGDPRRRASIMSGSAAADSASVQWTVETTTDISIVGTIAPDVSILLVQASAEDAQSQYHAVTSVVTDAKNKPSVLSCSWGGPEEGQPPALMRALNRWFEAAAVLGMTVCCSSGDFGNGTMAPGAPQNRFTAQFPASCPHVLACGGTTVHPRLGTEIAWKQKQWGSEMGSGGGFSTFFPLPPWQRDAGIDPRDWIPPGIRSGKGRAIPDIAAKANLDPEYSVIVGGIDVPAGGTSTAAPLWAAVVAILNEGLGARIGSLNRLLYDGSLRTGLRDIDAGNTGAFRACKGWDACTGWGSPRAEALLRALGG